MKGRDDEIEKSFRCVPAVFFVAATVHGAETYVVGAGSLNFRKEASLKSGFIGVVRKEEALTKVGESYNETEKLNWYKVRRKNGQENWWALLR